MTNFVIETRLTWGRIDPECDDLLMTLNEIVDYTPCDKIKDGYKQILEKHGYSDPDFTGLDNRQYDFYCDKNGSRVETEKPDYMVRLEFTIYEPM